MPSAGPVRAFLSYAHEDYVWRDRVLDHIGWLEHTKQLVALDDRQIKPGERWEPTDQAGTRRGAGQREIADQVVQQPLERLPAGVGLQRRIGRIPPRARPLAGRWSTSAARGSERPTRLQRVARSASS